MAIRSDLELDVTSALDAVEEVKAALEAAFTEAIAAFTDAIEGGVSQAIQSIQTAVVEVEADTSQAESDIDRVTADTDATVRIDGDTRRAEDAIEDFEQDIGTIVVPITANVETLTTDVESAFGDVEAPEIDVGIGGLEGIDQATESTDELSDGLENVATAAGSAVGVVGVLEGSSSALSIAQEVAAGRSNEAASALSRISPAARGAIGGVTALAGATAFLVAKAREGAAAQERLELVFGETAEAVQQINVGGLSGSLSDLARQSGNSTSQLRQSVATLGQLAESEGLTAGKTDELVERISALALRATVLNPQLGEAGRVMTQLQAALARGGRFASRFGISLTAAEITTRALSDTGKTAARDLTLLERAAAGAAISTEKLGDSIGTDFAQGIEQTSVRFKVLQRTISSAIAQAGAPLVEPTLQLLETVLPVATATATALGEVAEGAVAAAQPIAEALVPAVEALGTVLGLAGPVLAAIGTILDSVPQPVLAAAAAFVLLDQIMKRYVATAVLARTSSFALATSVSAIGAVIAVVGAAVAIFQSIQASRAKEQAQIDELTTSLFGELTGRQLAAGATAEQAAAIENLTTITGKYLAESSRFAESQRDQVDDIGRLGLSFDDLSAQMQRGEEGFREFINIAEAAGEIHFAFDVGEQQFIDADEIIRRVARNGQDAVTEIVAGNNDLLTSFLREQEALEEVGKNALDTAIVIGNLTNAQKKYAIEQTRGTDGHISYAAAAEFATDNVEELVEATGTITESQAILLNRLSDSPKAIEETALAWETLFQAIGTGAITAANFTQVAERFGVSRAIIEDFATKSAAAIDKFVQTVVSKLPETTAITEAFVSGTRTAFENVQTAAESLEDAQATFREATTRGLDSQRRAIRDAAESLDDARTELAKAVAERAVAGFEAETQEEIAREIENANEAIASASERVEDASVAFGDAQVALADASAEAQRTLAESQKELADAQDELTESLDPAKIAEKLVAQVQALQNFQRNIQELIARGQTRAAQEALALGPDVGAAFAQGLLDASPEVRGAVDEALRLSDAAKAQFEEDLRTDIVPLLGPIGAETAQAFADQYGIVLSTLPANTASQLDAIATVFGEKSPELEEAARLLGVDISAGYNNAISLKSGTELAIEHAANLIQEANPRLSREAAIIAANQDAAFVGRWGEIGSGPEQGALASVINDFLQRFLVLDAQTESDIEEVGTKVSDGIIVGLTSKESEAETAGRELVRGILGAINAEAGIKSPATLFEKPGEDMVAGIGVGIETGATDIPTKVQTMLNAAVNAAGLLAAASGVEVGHTVREGLALGMIDNLDKVRINARIMVLIAEQAAIEELEAESPSEMFARLGREIPAGLALGIGQETAVVADAATAMFTDFQDEVVGGFGDATVDVPVTFSATFAANSGLTDVVEEAETLTAEIPTVMVAPDPSVIAPAVADVEATTASIPTVVVPPADLVAVDDTITGIELLTATIDLAISADTVAARASLGELTAAIGRQTATVPVTLGTPDTTTTDEGIAAVEATTAEVPVRIVVPADAATAADDLIAVTEEREATVGVTMAATSPSLVEDVAGLLVADVEATTAMIPVGLSVADDADLTITAALASVESQSATVAVGFASPDLTPVTSAVNAAESRSAEIDLGVSTAPVASAVSNVIATAQSQSATIPVSFEIPDPTAVLAVTTDVADRTVEIPFSIVPALGAADAPEIAVARVEDLSAEIPVRTVLADGATDAAFALVTETEAQDVTIDLAIAVDPAALPTVEDAAVAVEDEVNAIEFVSAEIPVTTVLASGAIDAAAGLAAEAEARTSIIEVDVRLNPTALPSIETAIEAVQTRVDRIDFDTAEIPVTTDLAAGAIDAAANLAADAETQASVIELDVILDPTALPTIEGAVAEVQDRVDSIEFAPTEIPVTTALAPGAIDAAADLAADAQAQAAAIELTVTLDPDALPTIEATVSSVQDRVNTIEFAPATIPVTTSVVPGAADAAADLAADAEAQAATVELDVTLDPTALPTIEAAVGSVQERVDTIEFAPATIPVATVLAFGALDAAADLAADAEARAATIEVDIVLDPTALPTIEGAVTEVQDRVNRIEFTPAEIPVTTALAFGALDAATNLAADAQAQDTTIVLDVVLDPDALPTIDGAIASVREQVNRIEFTPAQIPVTTVLAPGALDAAAGLASAAEAQDSTIDLDAQVTPDSALVVQESIAAIQATAGTLRLGVLPPDTAEIAAVIDALGVIEQQTAVLPLAFGEADFTPVEVAVNAVSARTAEIGLGVTALPVAAVDDAISGTQEGATIPVAFVTPDPADVLAVVADVGSASVVVPFVIAAGPDATAAPTEAVTQVEALTAEIPVRTVLPDDATFATVPIQFDAPDPQAVLDDIEIAGAVIQLSVRAPDPEELAAILAQIEAQTVTVTARLAPPTTEQVVQVAPPSAMTATVTPLEVNTANVTATVVGRDENLRAADEALIARLTSLASVLESAVLASRPIEQTFQQEIDPLEAAAQTVWQLTRR